MAFSCTRRPNSLIVTTVTRSPSAPRSVKKAARALASSEAFARVIPPHSSVPRSVWWSQSPWSTVITSTPTSPLMTRATSRRARPRSDAGVLGAVGRARGLSRPARSRSPGAECRPHRTGPGPSARGPTACAATSSGGSGVPLVVAGDHHVVDAGGGHHRLGAVQRRRRDAAADAEGPAAGGVAVDADQPVEPARTRIDEPGSASSTSSIAAKCERLGAGSPVAWTAASLPAFHNGSSGASVGVQPERPVLGEQCAGGDRDPRPRGVVRGSACGTTSDSPSAAPRSDSTTSTARAGAAALGDAVTTAVPKSVLVPTSAAAPVSSPRRRQRGELGAAEARSWRSPGV